MLKLKSLERLVHEIGNLPGIGPKTAMRLTQAIVKKPLLSRRLREALNEVEENISTCPECFSYTETQTACLLCTSPQRENHVICVVEEPEDIVPIENSGCFKGKYHVLQGAISPLDGIGPEDLKISNLIKRIKALQQGESFDAIELIIALDPDLEGDTTALYLADLLQGEKIKLTRLAQGIPIGSDINYIDNRTISSALLNRVELS